MTIYLSIIVPLLNEEENIDKLVPRIVETGSKFDFEYEIILVDDGSTDGSWQRIVDLQKHYPQLRGIKLKRNYGQTSAMVAGFENAAGRIIITMDGDMQNDPADMPLLLEKIDQGYDIVSGWRKDRKDHFSRVLPSKIANKIISISTGVRLNDYGCSLKAYRADCIKAINAYGEMHRFFPAIASMTGARVTEIPVNHFERKYGVSKYGFDRIMKVFSDIFSTNLIIRFSSTPLKGFAICAIPFTLLALFFVSVSLLAQYLSWEPGKSLLFFFASALNGMIAVHLVILGILAELIVGTSDLKHTRLHEVTMEKLNLE